MQIHEVHQKPEVVYSILSNFNQVFWLDSAIGSDRLGQFSFIGCNPSASFEIDIKGNGVYCESNGLKREGEPWALLKSILQKRKTEAHPILPFLGGAVGFLSYELKHILEKLPNKAHNDFPLPMMRLDFYDWVYAFDHTLEKAYLGAYDDTLDLDPWISELSNYVTRPKFTKPDSSHIVGDLITNMSRNQYNDAISSIKNYIASGDIYQINFTQRFSGDFAGDVVQLYHQLRIQNPAPFASFLRYPHLEFDILSCSPERFISMRKGIIETRPIKGTVARGNTPEEEEANKRWLQDSPKDRSELLMIVDLQRNDLSKVAKRGSVVVPELFKIETYATVHHLVSTVQAEIRDDLDAVDLIKATFPGGSITGYT
jgi:para-aminobenzoate synthetase component I